MNSKPTILWLACSWPDTVLCLNGHVHVKVRPHSVWIDTSTCKKLVLLKFCSWVYGSMNSQEDRVGGLISVVRLWVSPHLKLPLWALMTFAFTLICTPAVGGSRYPEKTGDSMMNGKNKHMQFLPDLSRTSFPKNLWLNYGCFAWGTRMLTA